jgi:hypothetical protein
LNRPRASARTRASGSSRRSVFDHRDELAEALVQLHEQEAVEADGCVEQPVNVERGM